MKTKNLLLYVNLTHLKKLFIKKEISLLEYLVQKEKLVREIERL